MQRTPGEALNGNRLLAALESNARERVAAAMTLVRMEVRDVVYEDKRPFEHAYFPLDCVLSMIAVLEGAPESMVEVATVGNEGMVGLPIFLGADLTPGRAFAQIAGDALRIGADDLRALTASNGSFSRVLHRYTQSLLVQVSQTTACNRIHAAGQRCARWILMTQDRAGDEFELTQDFLGQMLGERGMGVTEVVSSLEQRSLIRYDDRRRMTVLDRSGLEHVACGCYSVVRDEYERMFAELGQGGSRA